MSEGDLREAARLPISIRRVYVGRGELTSAVEVYCAPRDCSMDVDRCEGCDGYAGLLLELEGTRKMVLCRRSCGEIGGDGGNESAAASPGWLRPEDPSPADRVSVSEVMTTDVICAREDLSRSV